MFDASFRTLFLSKKAKLSLKQNSLKLELDNANEPIYFPLCDILCIILESKEINITSALISALNAHKIIVFSCDSSHIPNGIFMPFNAHYRALKILNLQIALNAQNKAILWQQNIKNKINNQARLLEMLNKNQAQQLYEIAKNIKLNDSQNGEGQAASIYFSALFGAGFTRAQYLDENINALNAALNYGYAIIRGIFARGCAASGLNPLLGLNHKNQFNSFNLCDDLMESYRIFVDSLVFSMQHELENNLSLQQRARLAQILNAKIKLENTIYPLYRGAIISINSYLGALNGNNKLILPQFSSETDGIKLYEKIISV